MIGVALLEARLELGQSDEHPTGGPVRIATLERHRSMGHLAGQVDAQAQRALGHVADLTAFGFAADHTVHTVEVPPGDEVLGARHHPFFVHEGGEHEAPGERATPLQGVGGMQHGRDAGLHVGAAASVDAAVVHLGAEGVVAPTARVALGDDVGVSFEQKRRSRPIALDDGEHVRSAGCHFLDRRRPSERAHLLGDRLGDGRLAQAPIGVVDTRDPHQLARELDERALVDTGCHVGGS